MKKLDVQAIMMINAVLYLVAILGEHNPVYSYFIHSLITVISIIVLFILIKSKQSPLGFLFFIVTLFFKPFYFFIPRDSFPYMDIMTGVLIFILSFASEKKKK